MKIYLLLLGEYPSWPLGLLGTSQHRSRTNIDFLSVVLLSNFIAAEVHRSQVRKIRSSQRLSSPMTMRSRRLNRFSRFVPQDTQQQQQDELEQKQQSIEEEFDNVQQQVEQVTQAPENLYTMPTYTPTKSLQSVEVTTSLPIQQQGTDMVEGLIINNLCFCRRWTEFRQWELRGWDNQHQWKLLFANLTKILRSSWTKVIRTFGTTIIRPNWTKILRPVGAKVVRSSRAKVIRPSGTKNIRTFGTENLWCQKSRNARWSPLSFDWITRHGRLSWRTRFE